MTGFKRFLAFLLCLTLTLTLLPASVLATEGDVFQMDNGYIQVSVSKKNGGFHVNTVEGNLLKKSDNNKQLLYHSGAYDTSFVSFRVGSGAAAKDYLFGGKYAGSSAVSVTQATAGGEIVATWSADGITFTQTISLAEENASEHGMVSVSLAAQNGSGAAVPIQARVLLDTCLGDQDFSYYQINGGSLTHTMQTEQLITDEASLRSFYAVDDVADPAVTAYVVSNPVKAAVGHWNNLAASLFDFAPDATLNFTNAINDYLTADSACALYYDMGTVAAGGSGSVVGYYGVYSNHTVKLENSVVINTVAPLRLDMNSDKTAFVRQSQVGAADFAVIVSAENYASASARDLENVILAVRSTGGVRSLGDSGEVADGYDFDTVDPLTIPYTRMAVGETITKTLYFQAKTPDTASYERITIGMYKNSVTSENLLGEKIVYLLLPGSDGNVPKINFVSMSPSTIYSSGTRHLYVALTNEVIFSNALEQGICTVKAYSADGKTCVEIPSDNISVSAGVADVVIDGDIALALGNWYLQLEWTDEAVSKQFVTREFQKQTSSVLKFKVSDDPKFKNDSYGVLAAVKYPTGSGSSSSFIYRLESFKDEKAFKDFQDQKEPKKEILLVFRGEFTGDNRYPVKDLNGKITGYRYYTATSKKEVDPNTRETKVDNCITINNCLDFEGGTMSVYYEDYTNLNQDRAMESAILTEFEGDLYTSDERSSVWTGKAALTKLEQGQNFSLIEYDKDGNRKSTPANAITLIWPNVFSYAQTLAGMAFKLAYGQFGIMKDGDGKELGRTIGFAASLSLSFMSSPDPKDDTAPPDTYFGRMKELWSDWRGASIYQYAYHGDRFNKLTNIDMNDDTTAHNNAQKGVAGSVMVKDILFGCGEGFIGLNFTVKITVRNLIDSLPKIEGTLAINTINNWSFGLSGSCKFIDSMKLEAQLSFKSYENIPIPDSLYFYIGGFKPGLNIDGAGVVWLTGGGGGFSNLYDTIFCTSGLPPLKLILTASFSIVQILDGTAKLEIALSGINLTASDLKIQGQIEVIKKIQLGLQWYPDLKLQAGIYVSMFESTIEGQGYIILLGKNYTDWFFEMFVRAALKIPESVPGLGGMTLLGADLGISTEKIWGAFEALSIGIGVSYYWGEDSVNFGSAGDKAQPTYPNLLLSSFDGECEDFPVLYDAEKGRTLYAHIGTNFEAPRAAQLLSEGDLVLMGVAGASSNMEKTQHKFNLGTYAANNASTMVQLSFPAESRVAAEAVKNAIKITANQNGTGDELELKWTQPLDPRGENETLEAYEQRVAAQAQANKSANANFTWDEAGGVASIGFTVTKQSDFDRDWFFSTTAATDLILYNVLPMPKVDSVTAGTHLAAGGQIAVDWKGTGLTELDSISFFLAETDDPAKDAGYSLGSAANNNTTTVTSDAEYSTTLTIPADVPSGDYYVRVVYTKDEQLNAVAYSAARYEVSNDSTPAAAGAPAVSPIGNLQLSVSVPATDDANTTGYMVTVYNADGTATDVSGLTFDKAESGATAFEIGGSYLGTDGKSYGLTGGKSYTVGVTPYTTVDTDTDGQPDAVVYGAETVSAAVALPLAVTPTAALTAGGKTIAAISAAAGQASGNSGSVQAGPVFTTDDLDVAISFSEAVSGVWALDNSNVWKQVETAAVISGDYTDKESLEIALKNLLDGDHCLTLSGWAADGDSFSYSYPFTVDTTAPRLLISAPLSGSSFNADGTLTVTGVTDADALLTVFIDGAAQVSGKTVVAAGGTIDSSGVFAMTLSVPDYNGAATHKVVISAADACGNRTEAHELTVTNPNLGDLSELVLLVNNAIPADGNIGTATAGTATLSLVGVNSHGTKFALNPDHIYWNSRAAEGAASVSADGVLTYTANTRGFVEAMMEVSTGAYRTVALTLGSEPASGYVSVSGTIGGTVTGGGYYAPGDSVTLTATPDSGYRFVGWELNGVAVPDTAAATIRFTMPDGVGVTAKAVFSGSSGTGTPSGQGTTPQKEPAAATGGKVAVAELPAGADPNRYVPYYTAADGSTSVIPISAVIDGQLVYLVPEGEQEVRFMEVDKSFNDVAGHWAEGNMIWAAAHGLFNGMGNGAFNPGGTMTRAMFVTVLYRIAGSPDVTGTAGFRDVEPGAWYEKAVIWARANGIVNGITDTEFGTDADVTREQMCAFVGRFLRVMGFDLSLGAAKTFSDSDKISAYAKEDVAYCQRAGLINGYPDGSFNPGGSATRAENAAIMQRMIEAILVSLMA